MSSSSRASRTLIAVAPRLPALAIALAASLTCAVSASGDPDRGPTTVTQPVKTLAGLVIADPARALERAGQLLDGSAGSRLAEVIGELRTTIGYLDAGRPIGVLLLSRGVEVRPVLVLPKRHEDGVLEFLSPFLWRRASTGIGTYTLSSNETSLRLRLGESWAVLGSSPDWIAPDAARLDGVRRGEDDIAGFLDVNQWPQAAREAAWALWRDLVVQQAARRTGETHFANRARAEISQLVSAVGTVVSDFEGARLRARVDDTARELLVTIDAPLSRGSELPAALSAPTAGGLAPLCDRDAAFSLRAVFRPWVVSRSAIRATTAALRERLYRAHELKMRTDLESAHDWMKSWRALAGPLEALENAVSGAAIDLAFTVRRSGPGARSLLAGLRSPVVKETNVRSWLEKHVPIWVPLGMLEPGSLRAGTVGEFAVHSFRLAPRASEALNSGAEAEVRIATRGDTILCAVGPPGETGMLHRAIAALEGPVDATLDAPPIELHVSLDSLRTMAAGRGQNLPGSTRRGNHHVELAAEPTPEGVRVRAHIGGAAIGPLLQLLRFGF